MTTFRGIRYDKILEAPAGRASVYGVLADGRLTYTVVDVATGRRTHGAVTSTATLGFQPVAMATLDFSTILRASRSPTKDCTGGASCSVACAPASTPGPSRPASRWSTPSARWRRSGPRVGASVLDSGVRGSPADDEVRDPAGGTLVSAADAPSYWVLADPEGNRVCLCTWQDRD